MYDPPMDGRTDGRTHPLTEMLERHPSPDNPQKKNQNHHLGDPKIYQLDDVGYPKKQVAKSLQGTFFNKINLKTL